MHLNTRLFEPSELKDDASFNTAFKELAYWVGRGKFDQVAQLMLQRKNLAEFLISGADDITFARLKEWVTQDFSLQPNEFFGSTAQKLLNRFSSTLLSANIQSHAPPHLQKNHEEALVIASALEALLKLDHAPLHPSEVEIFQKLKLSVPKPGMAKNTGVDLLLKLRKIMLYYMDTTRLPDIAQRLRERYIGDETWEDTEDEFSVLGDSQSLQSMKASLQLDSASGFGRWPVIISSQGEKDLRQIRARDGKMYQIVAKKIRDLSNGRFSRENQVPLTESNVRVPIFKARMAGDARLVYHIDIIPHLDETEGETQAVRILGIKTRTETHEQQHLWTSVGKQLSLNGETYIQRCSERTEDFRRSDGTVDAPRSYYINSEFSEERRLQLDSNDVSEDDLQKLHSLLRLEKFFPVSKIFLHSIYIHLDLDHVFQVESKEREIIDHNSACYVLGRSGTGKTTTMVFKMLAIEWLWRLSSSTAGTTAKPRQLFVTQSQTLADKVKDYYMKLFRSKEAANMTPSELKQYAVFEAARMRKRKEEEETAPLVHPEDLDYRVSHLPKKFSLLRDEHFPLFIVYEDLCSLLEADFLPAENYSTSARTGTSSSSFSNVQKSERLSSIGYAQPHRVSLVSYDKFLGSYWDHFPQGLTRGFDPASVFAEFMGVIKGSEISLSFPKGFLDRQTYVELSHRSQMRFHDRREQVYDMFEAYTRMKRERGELDVADRTHKILRLVIEKWEGVNFPKIDYLYVDEVQDHLLIDCMLLRRIVRNRHGLFWAGDTAQTIALGSSFRFVELKAFQYRIEETLIRDSPKPLSMIIPKDFQLTVNYRSHAGILDCAQSVIELIEKFWPYSIDIISPEEGVIGGTKPVFFTNNGDARNCKSLYERIFITESGSVIEFGSQQCVIVRDDLAKTRLQEAIGDAAIVFTVYEAKGLEFDDVILWNFFEDSLVNEMQWRLVLTGLDASERGGLYIPGFQDNRHTAICTELKSLYVAITRSRKKLWIFDMPGDIPMKLYWKSKGRITERDLSSADETMALGLATLSSADQWSSQAKNLFLKKKFSAASLAFRRAKRPQEAAISDAYLLREQAHCDHRPLLRKKKFIEGAQAFLGVARASCHPVARSNFDQTTIYLRLAAECWRDAGEYLHAANAFVKAGCFTSGAESYSYAKKFEEVIEVLRRHEDEVDPQVAKRLMTDAKVFYLKRNELQTPKGHRLFSSDEDAIKFTVDYADFSGIRATLLEKVGRILEAAELHFTLRNPAEVVRLSKSVLNQLWERDPFRSGCMESAVADLAQRLEKITRAETRLIPREEHEEIKMFSLICSNNIGELRSLGRACYHSGNMPVALRCFGYIFDNTPTVYGTTHPAVTASLHTFSDFIHFFDGFRSLVNSADSEKHIQRLFGFHSTATGAIAIPEGSFLIRTPSGQPRTMVPKAEFRDLCNEFLRGRLTSRLKNLVRFGLAEGFVLSWYKSLAIIPKGQPHLKDMRESDTDAIRKLIHTSSNDLDSIGQSPDRKLKSLSSFMRTSLMAFAFDGDKCLPKLHDAKIQGQIFGFEAAGFIEDFKSSLHGEARDSILHGIRFLSFIFDNEVQVDIGILCDFIDWLAGCIVVAYRVMNQGSLHNTVLPRTWLLNLSRIFAKSGDKISEGAISPFLAIAERLFKQLDHKNKVSNAHLTFRGNLLSQAAPQVFHGYTSRLCRCICLLGGNIPIQSVRETILALVKNLPDQTQPLYRAYSRAFDWSDLREAVLRSSTAASLDDTILLRYAARRKEAAPVTLSEVVYWRLRDIKRCLLSGPKPMLLTGNHFTGGKNLEKIWNNCRAESGKIQWLSARHSTYFLGLLPYVLLYLEDAEAYIRSVFKSRDRPSDLRVLRASSADLVLLKAAIVPGSNPHHKSVEELHDKLSQIVQTLPATIYGQYSDDFKLAIKVYLTQGSDVE